jgi:hypothetical protein
MPERFSAENRAVKEPKIILIFQRIIARFEEKMADRDGGQCRPMGTDVTR